MTIFIVLLIIKFDSFGIYITFNFTDCVKSYNFQKGEEPVKWTWTQAELRFKKFLILTKNIF